MSAAGVAPAPTLDDNRPERDAWAGRAEGAPLDLHEVIRDPVARGCQRWPEHLRLLNHATGELIAGRCRASGRRSSGSFKLSSNAAAPHLNLIKGVPVSDAERLRDVIGVRWCSRVDALPIGQWVGAIEDGVGVVRYLSKMLAHGLKAEHGRRSAGVDTAPHRRESSVRGGRRDQGLRQCKDECGDLPYF